MDICNTRRLYGIGPYGLGYKYYDGKNLSAVCVYPRIERPDVYVFYWIRPMGQEILDIINKFAKHLLETYSMPTYVKKIFQIQFEYLQKQGFRNMTGFPWHSICHSEDNTYPEQIYNVKKTLSLLSTPPRTSNIRKSYRKAMQIEKKYTITMNDKDFTKIAWKITKDFFNSRYIKNK